MSDGTDLGHMMENLGAMASTALQASRIQFACETASRMLAAKIRDQHFIVDEDVIEAARRGLLLVDEVSRLCAEKKTRVPKADEEPSLPPITIEEIDRLHQEGKSP
jgi:ATP-dependent protease HslVU (ClpYQ) ATPase subunit